MMTPPHLMQSSALDEETARSELYGLLALCYYAQPTTEFIANLRVAATETPAAGAFLEASWRDLVGVAREMTPEEIQSEYQALFGGIGKPEVYLYGSHFLSGFLNEKPLARLRTDLTSLGLARDDAMSETEDHVAYLFEVMRFLIAGEDVADDELVPSGDVVATDDTVHVDVAVTAGDGVIAGDVVIAGDLVTVGDVVATGDVVTAGDVVPTGDTVTAGDELAAGDLVTESDKVGV